MIIIRRDAGYNIITDGASHYHITLMRDFEL